MKLLIHDLEEEEFRLLFPNNTNNLKIISDDHSIKNCVGCFSCWVKTPGTCVIRDNYADMGELLSKSAELIIISECFYGGFSPFVKNVLDRSISYIHPYFEIRNGEMHHRRRYDHFFDLKVWFYGANITDQEKQTAEKLIRANAINLECSSQKVTFVENLAEIREVIE
ncbi:MAG: flavodoxin family protein [Smithella sp.]